MMHGSTVLEFKKLSMQTRRGKPRRVFLLTAVSILVAAYPIFVRVCARGTIEQGGKPQSVNHPCGQ
jgi:hypothetical protein